MRSIAPLNLNKILDAEHDRRPAAGTQKSARFAMRERTADCHLETEEAFSRFDLTFADHYTAFLRAHLAALDSLEKAVAGQGWSEWQPRAPLLRADLNGLGEAARASERCAMQPLSNAEAWGAQYVIEGSALGGQVLGARIEPGLPRSYLTRGKSAGRSWRCFCDALDNEALAASKLNGRTSWIAQAERGARHAFAAFQKSARQMEPQNR
ncbi:biliverdin-producing heme oxygenase [Qipengyuania sp. DSG2-2]|uniref:biliverdin-producing heme oxygenase n=1 Tax=Qipengyuania sp. DGS2-2 TaxID=3349631 RepID=UPI0036D25A76